MKKRLAILFSAAIAATSCGTAAQYASSGQRYPDGIYYSRDNGTVSVPAETEDISQLVSDTQETQLLLFGDQKDTVVIPENKSAVIKFNGTQGTTVAITDDPFTEYYYNSTPWVYYRPVVYTSWAWDPWYYGRYWGYYDPWYWSSWYYDPWYWGYSSIWWDPWFYNPYFWGAPHLPYHPHIHHHHHHYHDHIGGPAGGPDRYYGHRTSSGSGVRRTYASRNGSASSASGTSSVRRGSSSSSTSGVRTSISRGNVPTRNTASSGITAVRRTNGTRVSGNGVSAGSSISTATGAQSRVSSSYRRGSQYMSSTGTGYRSSSASGGSTAVRNGVLTVPDNLKSASYNYRRPASSSVRTGGDYYSRSGAASGTVPSYRSSSSSGYRSSGASAGASSYSRSSSSYSRSSSSFSRSSSSFSRGSSSSFSRSSSSSSFSRGSSGGGSRSGGSYRR